MWWKTQEWAYCCIMELMRWAQNMTASQRLWFTVSLFLKYASWLVTSSLLILLSGKTSSGRVTRWHNNSKQLICSVSKESRYRVTKHCAARGGLLTYPSIRIIAVLHRCSFSKGYFRDCVAFKPFLFLLIFVFRLDGIDTFVSCYTCMPANPHFC